MFARCTVVKLGCWVLMMNTFTDHWERLRCADGCMAFTLYTLTTNFMYLNKIRRLERVGIIFGGKELWRREGKGISM